MFNCRIDESFNNGNSLTPICPLESARRRVIDGRVSRVIANSDRNGPSRSSRPRRNNERGTQSRDALIAAAIKLFAERGYAGTSIADIAAEAGTAKASVLYHFADKEAVWIEAVETLWGEVDAFYVASRLPAGRPALERLEHVLARFVEASLRWPAYVRIPFIEGMTPSWRSDWLVDRHFAVHIRFTDALLRELQAAGRLRPGAIAHYQALLSSSINVLVAQSAIWRRTYGDRLDDPAGLAESSALILRLMIVPECSATDI